MTTICAEVQLLSWSVSARGGAKIVLALSDEDDLEHFKLLTLKDGKKAGQILMAAFQAVEEAPDGTQPAAAGFRCGPLCRLAIQLCNSGDFQQWLALFFTDSWNRYGDIEPSARAKQFILDECGISSRKELDTNRSAADWFHRYIRLPFIDHTNG